LHVCHESSSSFQQHECCSNTLMAGCRCDLFDVGDALNDQAGQRIAAQPGQNVAAPAGRNYAVQLAGARARNQARLDAMMDAHRYSPPGHTFLLLFPTNHCDLVKHVVYCSWLLLTA